MTPEQLPLITSSFAKIFYTRDESAKIFYDRLFAIAPHLRALFKTDMASQGRKLMDTLALAVTTARTPERLTVLLEDTAKRHAEYGAKPQDYVFVGEALIWTLERQLGNDFTPAMKAAWEELYQKTANAMQHELGSC
jgi:hemoglobin-like flavoprotein